MRFSTPVTVELSNICAVKETTAVTFSVVDRSKRRKNCGDDGRPQVFLASILALTRPLTRDLLIVASPFLLSLLCGLFFDRLGPEPSSTWPSPKHVAELIGPTLTRATALFSYALTRPTAVTGCRN